MRTLHAFHGGIHPPERKSLSRPGELRDAGLPPQLVLPLMNANGSAAQPAVATGQRVLGGELLAAHTDHHAPQIYAPTSGTVTAIEARPVAHPSGLAATCLVLAVDGQDQWLCGEPCEDWRSAEPDHLLARVRDSGVAGLGGAGFPTAVKLAAGRGNAVETLLINGAECEPYITADDTLMQTAPDSILEGAAIMAHILGAQQILIAIEDNKADAIAALERALANRADDAGVELEVVTIPTRYPSGGEKQLIEIISGRQVPSGGHPSDIGIVCQNPGTAVAVADAIARGKPMTERIVTLTGEALADPHNVRARFGTPIDWLLAQAGFTADGDSRVIHGGPMMGFRLADLRAPIGSKTNCLLVPTAEALPPLPPEQACIRCGHCAEVCPASLLPQQLYWYARAKDAEQLQQHRLFDCIECGACAWVCPSHIPLVQYYRAAKDNLREAAAEKRRAETAKQRFETRERRVARQLEAREAKRAARRAAATEAAANLSLDPVQAAIARAQAKRAAAGGDNEDPIKAAIARAAAKKAQRAQTWADSSQRQPQGPDGAASPTGAQRAERDAAQTGRASDPRPDRPDGEPPDENPGT